MMPGYGVDAYEAAFVKLAARVSLAQRRMLAANAAAKGRTLDVLALA